jgi:hypothetical protein
MEQIIDIFNLYILIGIYYERGKEFIYLGEKLSETNINKKKSCICSSRLKSHRIYNKYFSIFIDKKIMKTLVLDQINMVNSG